MSREVRRVALDFEWPLHKIWANYLMPDRLVGRRCDACDGSGDSPRARELSDLWYGYRPFRPEDNGSTPFTADTPAARAFAERNVVRAPGYYGFGEWAIRREAQRLADLWNSQWCHHLNADDVAALIEADRLMDLTHQWTPEARRQPLDPPVVPTPEQVNEWATREPGHDEINSWVVIKARCLREGALLACALCEGRGSTEMYPGQRAESDAWKPTEPPGGDGWQLWETTTEGSPISPVFSTDEALAGWLTTAEGGWAVGTRQHPVHLTLEQARGFVRQGWAPTFIENADGLYSGAEWGVS